MTDILLALTSVVFTLDSFLQWRHIERLREEAQIRDDSLRALRCAVYDMQKQLARRKRKEAQP